MDTLKIFPCGKCTPCVITRRQEWTARILLEGKLHLCQYFVTLTYHERDLPEHGELEKEDLQLFFKRLRKNTGIKIRYFASGEYGSEKDRPHYHAILFTDREFDIVWKKLPNGTQVVEDSDIHQAWYTNSKCDLVPILGNRSKKHIAAYVAGYVLKKLGQPSDKHERKEFILTSRNPGLGAEWAKIWGKQLKQLGIGLPGVFNVRLTNDIHMVTIDGKKYPTGRYLRDKLYEALGGDQRSALSRQLAQHHRAMDQIEQAEIIEELETESQAKARKAYKSYLKNRGL